MYISLSSFLTIVTIKFLKSYHVNLNFKHYSTKEPSKSLFGLLYYKNHTMCIIKKIYDMIKEKTKL